MPDCKKCGKPFKNWEILKTGAVKNLGHRVYCLDCSPWGKHNTKRIHKKVPTERRCPKCKRTLQSSEFYHRRGIPGSSAYCKGCTNAQTVERSRATKLAAIAYKGGKCQACGYNKYYGAMDFHHLDPSKKSFSFGGRKCKSLESLKPELDKCILLCCRCHTEVEGKVIPCP